MPPYLRTMTFGLLATATVAAAIMIVRPGPPVAPAVEAKATVAPPRQEGRQVAITFDDLPALAQCRPGTAVRFVRGEREE